MIHEENKNQQPEKESFSIENFLTDEKKEPEQEQNTLPHSDDLTAICRTRSYKTDCRQYQKNRFKTKEADERGLLRNVL